MRVATPPRSHLARQRATLGLVRASVASPSLDPRSVSRRRLTSPLPPRIRRENASESLSDMSTLLNNSREDAARGLVRPRPVPPDAPCLRRRRARHFPAIPSSRAGVGRADDASAGRRSARGWRTIRDPARAPTASRGAASRPDLPVPRPSPCVATGRRHRGVDVHEDDVDAPPRHLQRHGRDHDHPHGRARDERESYRGTSRAAPRVRRRPTPADSDSSLDRPPTLSRAPASRTPLRPVVAFSRSRADPERAFRSSDVAGDAGHRLRRS